jgi:hypothetical protein
MFHDANLFLRELHFLFLPFFAVLFILLSHLLSLNAFSPTLLTFLQLFAADANTFKKSLLEGSSTMSAELDQVAQQGLHHAKANLETVLGSPVYRDGVAFSGYLLRVDLSFAAFFLLTSAAAFPHRAFFLQHPSLFFPDRVFLLQTSIVTR